jgi:hypothetical protein
MSQKAFRLFIWGSLLVSLILYQNCGPAKLSGDTPAVALGSVAPNSVDPTPTPSATPGSSPSPSPTATPAPTPTPTTSALKTSEGFCLEQSTQADQYSALKLVQAPCNGSNYQMFTKESVSANVFRLLSVANGQCMNVPGGLTEDGTIVDFWQCYNDYAGHQWLFLNNKNGNGSFMLVEALASRCLTANSYGSTTDQQLYLTTCDPNNPLQQFHY